MKQQISRFFLIFCAVLFSAQKDYANNTTVSNLPSLSPVEPQIVRSLSLKSSGPSTISSNWGLDAVYKDSWINIADAWKKFKKKSDVVVAIIDTGIDPEHSYLKDNIHVLEGTKGSRNYGKDFSVASSGIQRSPSSRAPIDRHGHGTHVAGIIKGVFSHVKIVPIKYYNPNRSGQENLNSLIQSLEYAIEKNVDIINYSGGGPEPSIRELEILKKAEQKGILIVAAAGNESANIDKRDFSFYPASYNLNNIIAVTAHNKNLEILPSSNWGEKSVDLSAPGHRIYSSIPKNLFAHMTGTSQATAFVSGVAAIIKAELPSLSAQEIKIILRRSVRKVTHFRRRCISGGRLDASTALAVARQYRRKKPRPSRKSAGSP